MVGVERRKTARRSKWNIPALRVGAYVAHAAIESLVPRVPAVSASVVVAALQVAPHLLRGL